MEGIYLIWHGDSEALPRMHSGMMQANSPGQAAEDFANDVIYQERLEEGHRIFVLGPFDPEQMEREVGNRFELQEILQDILGRTTPFEYRLIHRWEAV